MHITLRRFLLAATTLLVTASCVRTRTDPVTGRTDVDIENPAKRGEDWSGSLRGMNQWTGITGTARAEVLHGETTTTLQVRGATPGMSHPWHLHDGTCASGGPIVGPAGAYPPITIGTDGSGNASARVSGTLNEAKKYHVNVHRSASDLATIIACADITD